MPVASLPNRFGSGDFGPDAYRFADDIAEAGFSIWQLLPMNPLGYGNSPYQPFSSYAMDEIYISLDQLEKEGLIAHAPDHMKNAPTIQYQDIRVFREKWLREAFHNFKPDRKYRAFVAKNDWLESYAVFMAFKRKNDLRCWVEWPAKMRDYPELKSLDLTPYEEDINYQRFLQYKLYEQWTALKKYVNKKGIEIMGDLPFYVGLDSADCWNGRPNFLLTKKGKPRFIAGVPPDYFSETGQRWGNPIYDWEYMKQDQFGFWTERIGYSRNLFDIIRLDHFRAFDTYWKIPASCPTAVVGKWVEAPGNEVFEHLLKTFPKIHIIAEDLGDLRPEVLELRDRFNFAGMHVMVFEFQPDQENTMNAHSLLYSGTHDNETVKSWYKHKSKEEQRAVRNWLTKHGFKGINPIDRMLKYALSTDSEMVIIPMADWLFIDERGTINHPGTVGSPNWEWRLNSFRPFEQRIPAIKEDIRTSGRH